LDSNRLHLDRTLSAEQIRAGRGLLGWSRRDLAIVAGISQGTIKAIEQGTTDARLSTLQKLAQNFAAHDVQFVAEGTWTGVVIKTRTETSLKRPPRIPRRCKSVGSMENAELGDEPLPTGESTETGDKGSVSGPGFQWLGPLIRVARTRKA
jgi:transcriptional regulator with XRE-family HTH domain